MSDIVKFVTIKGAIEMGIGSRTTIYRLEHEDSSFPKRRVVRGNVVKFVVSELETWMATRPTVTPRQKDAIGSGRPGPGRPRKIAA